MRHARGVVALVTSLLLGWVLVTSAQTAAGDKPYPGLQGTTAAPLGRVPVPQPLVAKRWS